MNSDKTTHKSLDGFASPIKLAILSGEISGAVVALATQQKLRVEALGLQRQNSDLLVQRDTIFRIGSMAKAVFTVAAMILLENKKLRLEDNISKWIPELAERRVLRTPDSELDDTVPAVREITVFDVLTFQLGIGIYLAQYDTPLLRAMYALGIAPSPDLVPFDSEEFIFRLGSLPLAHHPGDTFMYHTGDDVLRVLIMRITGQPLGEFLQERIFEPLAMVDSGLSVSPDKLHRLSTCYFPQTEFGETLAIWDAADNRFTQAPIFPNSIVSTVGDYLNFSAMLLGNGVFRGRQFLHSESVTLMMTDHLSDEQKWLSPSAGFWDTKGWGMGGSVYTRSLPQGPNSGSYSWFGGYGGHFIIDKKRESVVISLIPRVIQSSRETILGYQFERDTYRDILMSGES